jgi:hypothetical protein
VIQEFRSSGVQEFRSSGVQEFRSSGVQFEPCSPESRLLLGARREERIELLNSDS